MRFFVEETVENTVFKNTSGYDLHFVIAPGHEDSAARLRQQCRAFLEAKLPGVGFIVYDETFDTPIGPWKQPMWFIEICTVDRLNDLANPNAGDEDKLRPLFALIRQTQAHLSEIMNQTNVRGSLFIHANTLPHNSDMQYERALHLNHSWTTGPAADLIDIWGEENGLIAQENFIKAQLAAGSETPAVIEAFKSHFSGKKPDPVLEKNAHMLLDGQQLKQQIQDRHDPVLQ